MKVFKTILFIATALMPAFGARAGTSFTVIAPLDLDNPHPFPYAPLIRAVDGNLYGTLNDNAPLVTACRLTPDGTLTTNIATLAAGSQALLWLQGADGFFYGSTEGNDTNSGTIFRMASDGTITTVKTFDETLDGFYPRGLIEGHDGNIYGVTIAYGPSGSIMGGTIFRLTSDGALTNLHAFMGGSDGSTPFGLLQTSKGDFYGTCNGGTASTIGGNIHGQIFRLSSTGMFTVVHVLQDAEGDTPVCTLAEGADGNLYGVANYGGPSGPDGRGTLFRTTTNGAFTVLHAFTGGADGSHPYGHLVRATDGNVYGRTFETVYRITPDGVFTTVYTFSPYQPDSDNGRTDSGYFMQDADGNFYGTGLDCIFRLSLPLQPMIQSVTKTNDTLAFSWSSVAGQTYQLQFTSDLSQTNWNDLGSPMTATNGVMSASDPIGEGSRFYRVAILH
jgi:uncharacterized repeat protein (TIGR03803 family)